MINEVLDQLTYLKLKSAYAYLKELHINDEITNSELKGIYKILKGSPCKRRKQQIVQC